MDEYSIVYSTNLPLLLERKEKLKGVKGLIKEFINLQSALSVKEGGESHVDLSKVKQQA